MSSVQLWSLTLPTDDYAERDLVLLSADEKQRAGRYHFARHRARFITRRAALRRIIAITLNQSPESIVFTYNDFGKPEIHHANITFSLSHDQTRCIIALTHERSIGIDIQKFTSRQLANWRQLVNRELETQETLQNDQMLIQLWMEVEAYTKMTGEGFYAGIRRVLRILTTQAPLPQPCYMCECVFKSGAGVLCVSGTEPVTLQYCGEFGADY